jgi:hypothetical protein
MVHSSTLTITTDGEHLTCGGFSLGKTVHSGSLEFIVDCFGNLSFSPKGSDSSTVFLGMVHSGSPSLGTILEGSKDEFYMASSREGSSSLPDSWRHNMGTLPAPITTTPWPEDALTSLTMRTVPLRTIALWLDVGLSPEQRQAFQEGQRARTHAEHKAIQR